MKYIIVILTVLMLSGCDALKSHSRYILENKDKICAQICSQPIDTERHVTTKDTVYVTTESSYVPVDSMSLSLYLYCDSNNQVILKNYEGLKSIYGKMLFDLNKGKLTIKALYDSLEVKNKTIHDFKTDVITVTTKVPVYVDKVIKEKYIPWWIFLIMGAGAITIIYLLIRKLF
jgi:hypothetical protein